MCYSYLNSKTWAAQPTPAHKWRESLTEQSISVWARVSTQCLFLVFVVHLFVVLYYNITGITVNVSYSYLWLIHLQLEDISRKKPSSYWNETQCYVCFSSRDFWCLTFFVSSSSCWTSLVIFSVNGQLFNQSAINLRITTLCIASRVGCISIIPLLLCNQTCSREFAPIQKHIHEERALHGQDPPACFY